MMSGRTRAKSLSTPIEKPELLLPHMQGQSERKSSLLVKIFRDNSRNSVNEESPPGENTLLLPHQLVKTATAYPVRQYKSITLSVCSFILTAEFCMLLVYATITGSLPIFAHKHFGLNNVVGTGITIAFCAMTNLTPIIGGYVADVLLGRFHTIMIFGVIYLIGLLLVTISAIPSVSSLPLCMVGLFGGLALGAGGIKPNVVVLGAEQFDTRIEQDRMEKDSFFNWYYWSVNMGSFLSFGILANISVNGIPDYIPQEDGFVASFAGVAIAFALGLIVFYSARHRYRQVPPEGSALHTFMAIFLYACRQSCMGLIILSGCIALIIGLILTVISFLMTESSYHMYWIVIGVMCLVYGMVVFMASGRSSTWILKATNQKKWTTAQIDDVRQVVRLLPYMAVLISFWITYSQMMSNFVIQGCQMNLKMGGSLLSAASLAVVDCVVLFICLPVLDGFIYPFLRSHGIVPTLLRRIGTGLVISAVTMMISALVEVIRKQQPMISNVNSNCAAIDEILPMSQLSIWWQTPQYVLSGISDILTTVSAYDLFYSEVPDSMQSVCQALNLLSVTYGYVVSGAINSLLSSWITSDLNQGRLEYVYGVIAVLVMIVFIVFLYIAQSFEYCDSDDQQYDVDPSGFAPLAVRARRVTHTWVQTRIG